MIWLLIGYMWLFIQRPFEIWPVLGAFRIERVYMIVTITYWIASGPRLPNANRLHQYFAGFVLVMLVSWFLSPYKATGDPAVENYLKYSVFYVLLVTSVRNEQDLRTLLVAHFCILTLVMAHTVREYFNGNAWYAQGIVRMQGTGQTFRDPNDFAGLVVCCLPFAWVLWRQWSGRWRRAAILGHIGLACYCVVATGSRMGMLGVVLAGLLASLGSPHRWRLLVLYAMVLAAAWTVLPEDRKSRYLTLYDSSLGPAAATASGSRLRYAGFEAAIPVFQQAPLLGFGPHSYGEASGSGHQPHNLYGQLLAELGIAGAVAFGLVLWGVAQNTLYASSMVRGRYDVDDLAWRTVVAAAAAFLLLVVMAWGFNFLFWHVWLWFGAFQVVALQLLKERAASCQLSEDSDLQLQTLSLGKTWT